MWPLGGSGAQIARIEAHTKRPASYGEPGCDGLSEETRDRIEAGEEGDEEEAYADELADVLRARAEREDPSRDIMEPVTFGNLAERAECATHGSKKQVAILTATVGPFDADACVGSRLKLVIDERGEITIEGAEHIGRGDSAGRRRIVLQVAAWSRAPASDEVRVRVASPPLFFHERAMPVQGGAKRGKAGDGSAGKQASTVWSKEPARDWTDSSILAAASSSEEEGDGMSEDAGGGERGGGIDGRGDATIYSVWTLKGAKLETSEAIKALSSFKSTHLDLEGRFTSADGYDTTLGPQVSTVLY